MTKPSERSNREAHDALRKLIVKELANRGWSDPATVVARCAMFDYPPDPVERVSDLCLQNWAASQAIGDAYHMAIELIERRAKDKQK